MLTEPRAVRPGRKHKEHRSKQSHCPCLPNLVVKLFAVDSDPRLFAVSSFLEHQVSKDIYPSRYSFEMLYSFPQLRTALSAHDFTTQDFTALHSTYYNLVQVWLSPANSARKLTPPTWIQRPSLSLLPLRKDRPPTLELIPPKLNGPPLTPFLIRMVARRAAAATQAVAT